MTSISLDFQQDVLITQSPASASWQRWSCRFRTEPNIGHMPRSSGVAASPCRPCVRIELLPVAKYLSTLLSD